MKFPIDVLVEVYWGDAYEHIGKNFQLDYKKSLTRTVGWIVKVDNRRIYLSMFWCGIAKRLSSPYVAIPKGMIEKVCKKSSKAIVKD